jgi:hypothetical protein
MQILVFCHAAFWLSTPIWVFYLIGCPIFFCHKSFDFFTAPILVACLIKISRVLGYGIFSPLQGNMWMTAQ